MSTNGFRGSQLPPGRRVARAELVRVYRAAAGTGGNPAPTLSNVAVLADYLATFGPQELNLFVMNQNGRTETNVALAGVFDMLDLLTFRTTHGREPSTFNKELMPGIAMSPTLVREAVGEWGIQSAADELAEGVATLGPRTLTPPPDGESSPMMWLQSSGDPQLGETLYAEMDRLHRPHRHMWSHHEDASGTLKWLILYQLRDDDLDVLIPELRAQPAYATFVQRADRFHERLSTQSGIKQ